MYHDVYTQYLFIVVINKLHMCTSQFNLTRMFLNSCVACCLGVVILFHILVNCLGVDWIDCLYVCRVCFDCASHQRCTVVIYCASTVSEWPCFQRKNGFFLFFSKKMDSRHKKNKKTVLVSPDVSLTSVVIRQLHLTWQLTSVLDNYVRSNFFGLKKKFKEKQ